MFRKIISVILGLVAAIIIFVVVESLNGSLHPFPSDLDLTNTEAVQSFYHSRPLSFWILVILGWVIGSFICGVLIGWIGKTNKKILPVIAGIVLTLSAVANFFLLPHPTWFVVVGILIFMPSVMLGHKIIKFKKALISTNNENLNAEN